MPFDLVGELISTYKPPPQKMVARMEAIARTVPEDAREDVFNAILEELGANYMVGANNITDACKKLGVAYSETHYIPATAWICDGCGREFRYHPCPSDDDKIDKGIFDFCPDCGLKPHYTTLAQEYNRRGIKTPWYDKMVAASKLWGPDVPVVNRKTRMGGTYPTGGVYWSRYKAEQERREEKRIEVEAKMSEIDRAKRWDIDKEA